MKIYLGLSQNSKLKQTKNGGKLIMWKTVKGFSKYEVNEDGVIRNKKTGHILSVNPNNSGYPLVNLFLDGKGRKTVQVSKIVANTWLENPNNYPEIDHLDKNPANNAVSNLEWVSTEENIRRKSKTIRSVQRRVRPVAQYDKQGNFIAAYPNMAEAESQTGISNKMISRVVRHEYGRNTTGGYIWRYYDE